MRRLITLLIIILAWFFRSPATGYAQINCNRWECERRDCAPDPPYGCSELCTCVEGSGVTVYCGSGTYGCNNVCCDVDTGEPTGGGWVYEGALCSDIGWVQSCYNTKGYCTYRQQCVPLTSNKLVASTGCSSENPSYLKCQVNCGCCPAGSTWQCDRL
jgi:hypothetical protein